MKTLILVLIVSAAAPLYAFDADMIGVFFDTEAMAYEHHTSSPNEAVTAYLLLINPSDSAGVSGWECWVQKTGATIGETWTLSAGLNVDDSGTGHFQVGIGVAPLALPAEQFILLATWTGFIAGPNDIVRMSVFPNPNVMPFEQSPSYGSGSDAAVSVPMEPYEGCPGYAGALINEMCGLPSETRSWGEVKTLFH